MRPVGHRMPERADGAGSGGQRASGKMRAVIRVSNKNDAPGVDQA